MKPILSGRARPPMQWRHPRTRRAHPGPAPRWSIHDLLRRRIPSIPQRRRARQRRELLLDAVALALEAEDPQQLGGRAQVHGLAGEDGRGERPRRAGSIDEDEAPGRRGRLSLAEPHLAELPALDALARHERAAVALHELLEHLLAAADEDGFAHAAPACA